MALNIQNVERVLKLKSGVEILIQDNEMSVEEAMAVYSTIHPELTTATVEGPKFVGDKYVYTVKSTIGTKG